MSAIFTAELRRDVATDSYYVLIIAWGEWERDTNACEWDVTEYSGPLTESQLAYVRDTRHTSQLDWSEELPEGWDAWEQIETIWADVGGEP